MKLKFIQYFPNQINNNLKLHYYYYFNYFLKLFMNIYFLINLLFFFMLKFNFYLFICIKEFNKYFFKFFPHFLFIYSQRKDFLYKVFKNIYFYNLLIINNLYFIFQFFVIYLCTNIKINFHLNIFIIYHLKVKYQNFINY